MTNIFLKINKDLFNLGLNPTEILVLAQVMEFNVNTNDCFISDKQLASMFGVSEKTIQRAIKVLEDKKYIKRETKNIKGGKERHLFIDFAQIEAALTTDKMTVENTQSNLTTDKMSVEQRTKCLLNNGQIDLIKDNNLKDNLLKDNLGTNEAKKSFDDMTEAERKQAFKF